LVVGIVGQAGDFHNPTEADALLDWMEKRGDAWRR